MKIAYFGMPLGALVLERAGHDVVYAAISLSEAIGLRRVRRVLGDRVRVRPDISAPPAVQRIASSEPDLIVSWFWTKRIPREVLELGRLGAFGVHPSLLPRHRGPDPYFWAIDAGDLVTGVTAHVLEMQYDTGGILGKIELPIDPQWNAWTLAKKLDRPSLRLLRDTAAAYAHGTARPTPQDESQATLAPEPNEDMLELRWSQPAEAIHRRVRAAATWPGAFTEIASETIVLLETRVTTDFPRALEPGEAAVREDGIAVVRAADLAIELHRARRDLEDDVLDETALARLVSGLG